MPVPMIGYDADTVPLTVMTLLLLVYWKRMPAAEPAMRPPALTRMLLPMAGL
jgi:hypothetical protein